MNSYRIEVSEPDQLVGGMTTEAAARRILLSCARNFDANLAAVLSSDDAQGPHHARVALRRMRSALGAFARIIDKEAGAEVESRAKRFFRLLGRVRDADVLLLDFATASDRAALAAEAAEIRADVRATLRLRGALAFSPALLKRLEDGSFFRTGNSARLRRAGPVEDCATRALDKVWRQCTAHGMGLDAMTEGARHDLRKDLKSLRYLSEFFAPLWPEDRATRFLDRMRGLQDALGDLNDIALARTAARRDGDDFAAHDARARQALADAGKTWQKLVDAGPWWH